MGSGRTMMPRGEGLDLVKGGRMDLASDQRHDHDTSGQHGDYFPGLLCTDRPHSVPVLHTERPTCAEDGTFYSI